jgi:molybdopterin-containing oxidoreductase family membrane subunit
MVLTLAIPLRKAYGLEDFITARHLNNMAKVMLSTGLIVAYGYLMETFTAFYGSNAAEQTTFIMRFKGPYALFYWMLILCNIAIPQLLWFRGVRRNVPMLFVISIIINIGMWLERFIIIVTSLSRNFMQSKWGMYYPTFWEWSLYFGSIGLFLAMLFLFIRFLPVISVFEMRELVSQTEYGGAGEHQEPMEDEEVSATA